MDCFLITSDKELVPDHRPYGPETWMRVTVGVVYEQPLHIHVFADHYRYPWYSHWYISKAGAFAGLQPKNKADLLTSGEQTPWCNITRMLHEDSGAILNLTARHTYGNRAKRLNAKIELATAPAVKSIVRTFDIDSSSNGAVIIVPAHLESETQRQWLTTAGEVAEKTGQFADNFDWPTIGRVPQRMPVFASFRPGGYGTPVDPSIEDREWKTLNYFGFSNRNKYRLHGHIWRMKEGSYCRPDMDYMRKNAEIHAAEFFESGKKVDNVAYCFLTDEPTGQPLALMAKDSAYHDAFRDWLKNHLKKTPADLLVSNWEEVKPVTDGDKHPALYYYSQRFRTRALGDFMTVQKRVVEEVYQKSFPSAVNFSDGAVYSANFYSQGVDYFELLDDPNQNAIWGEDWANNSSSYQCGAYNVDLMRSAARDRGQLIGHYLIAYAGRKSWDIKTKAAGETARGVRVWNSFSYGPSWGSHEGGPLWRNHAWYSKPEVWRANAEVVRELGAVEDMIIGARPDPAEVAIIYSSSSDIWTLGKNNAFGFNRMHNWMALSHAQIPVDIIAERQVVKGRLQGKKVCYLSGPNLTRAAAVKVRQWVEAGGTLVLSAGAASFDEFNRPLDIISEIVPAERSELQTEQAFLNSGSFIHRLREIDTVSTVNDSIKMEVLSVQQQQKPVAGATVEAVFSDGSAALVRGDAGKGMVFSYGYLPALDYIKKALVERQILVAESETKVAVRPQSNHPAPPVELAEAPDPSMENLDPRIGRSYNPWEFPDEVRNHILNPVVKAEISRPLVCDTALIDAVVLRGEAGLVIPLANHTLVEQDSVTFELRTGDREIGRVESVHHGDLKFNPISKGIISFSVPLKASDYLMIHY